MRAPHNTEARCLNSSGSVEPRQNCIAHGSPDVLREFVAECLSRTNFYSGMGAVYAAVADDAGLDYSIRCAIASLRQAVSVSAMLKEAKQQARKERAARRFEGLSA